MKRLKVDTDALQGAADDLDLVRKELAGSEVKARALADAVGNADLADAVGDFSSTWETRRGKIVESLEGLVGSLRIAGDNFEQADEDLAKGLGGPR